MRKRLVCLFLCLSLMTSALPGVTAQAAAEPREMAAPVIALTDTPRWGEERPIAGIVFTEDGSDFTPSAWRVTLYLQLTPEGEAWVKPYANHPYAELSEDGSFSIRYCTGGDDVHAVILYLLLLPVDWFSIDTPAPFAKAAADAADMVKISRTDAGEVAATPERAAPSPEPVTPASSSGLTVSPNRIALNVGFYTEGSAPGSPLSGEQIRRQLEAVSAFADTVRFYGAAGEINKAYSIAAGMGFTVLGNAWLSGDSDADRAELDALIDLCNRGYVRAAIVGSETLYRGELSPAELTADLRYVRERLTDRDIPVTTADSIHFFCSLPELRQECDILMPNSYPYWNGTPIEAAAEAFAGSLAELKALSGGKEIVVSETGWPTAGQTVGGACAGEAEATAYFSAVRAWSLAAGVPVLWFAAADEPWKAAAENEAGAHWGLMTSECIVKRCFAELEFFREAAAPSLRLVDAARNGTEVTVKAVLSGGEIAGQAVAAVYDAEGRMLAVRLLPAERQLHISIPCTQAASSVRLFWVDNRFLPVCEAVERPVSALGDTE